MYNSNIFKYSYGCILRKQPFLIAKDQNSIVVQIEGTCPLYAKLVVDRMPQDFELYHVFDEFHHVYRSEIKRQGCFKYHVEYSWAQRASQSSTPQNQVCQGSQRFVLLSDNQFKSTIFNQLIKAIEQQNGVDYIVHVGDAVQDNHLRAWEVDFFWPMEAVSSRIPLIYVPGNHDDVPQGRKHYLYTSTVAHRSMTFDRLQIIQVNSNYDTPEQLDFVKQLQREDKFTVLLVHIPPYIEYWEKDAWFKKEERHWGEFVREKYLPLLPQVDLVISGHQHNYQRTSRRQMGKYFMIIGGAGGSLESENGRVADHNMYDMTYFGHFWCMMDVYSSKALWRVFDKSSDLIDDLTLNF